MHSVVFAVFFDSIVKVLKTVAKKNNCRARVFVHHLSSEMVFPWIFR